MTRAWGDTSPKMSARTVYHLVGHCQDLGIGSQCREEPLEGLEQGSGRIHVLEGSFF